MKFTALKYILAIVAFSFLFGGILLLSKVDVHAAEGGVRGVIFQQQQVNEILCAPDLNCYLKPGGILVIDLLHHHASAQTSGNNSAAITGDGNKVTINGKEQ